MKFITRTKIFLVSLLLAVSGVATGQLIYGNTFPFWNVNGPLTVTGTSTLAITNILGLTDASTPPAGYVGEILSGNTTFASAAGILSTVSANVTSVALTPGEWSISGVCNESFASVTFTVKSCGLGLVSATQLTTTGGSGVGTDPLVSTTQTFGATLTGLGSQTLGQTRFASSGSATVYLVIKDTFTSSSGTNVAWGTINARRLK